MDNLILILFICISTPLILMLFLLEKKARIAVGFMIIGMFMCMFISGINGLLLNAFSGNMFYVTTTITPITEEIIKALPIIIFAFFISAERKTLITTSMAVGIGFAIMENAFIMVSTQYDTLPIVWALVRGFGAGLMHGVCTAAIGIGVSFVHTRKKLFFPGTIALLVTAIIYHAIYNSLVQSSLPFIGFLLPLATYIPIIIAVLRDRKKKTLIKADKSSSNVVEIE